MVECPHLLTVNQLQLLALCYTDTVRLYMLQIGLALRAGNYGISGSHG